MKWRSERTVRNVGLIGLDPVVAHIKDLVFLK